MLKFVGRTHGGPRNVRREAAGSFGVVAISVNFPDMIEHIFYFVKCGNGWVRCIQGKLSRKLNLTETRQRQTENELKLGTVTSPKLPGK